ncbi:MAG: PilZ domain-containing protein [Deltaproteobacteria bacterium]|nr:PilZ domain-containing protein [Deltaproteobacteria bacterium]
MPPREQRVWVRVPLMMSVECRFADGVVIRGETKDLGFGGLFLFSPLQRPVGQLCQVRITSRAGADAIEATARIHRCDELGMALLFTALLPPHRERLRDLLVGAATDAAPILRDYHQLAGTRKSS